jgi:hypothetical protein
VTYWFVTTSALCVLADAKHAYYVLLLTTIKTGETLFLPGVPSKESQERSDARSNPTLPRDARMIRQTAAWAKEVCMHADTATYIILVQYRSISDSICIHTAKYTLTPYTYNVDMTLFMYTSCAMQRTRRIHSVACMCTPLYVL